MEKFLLDVDEDIREVMLAKPTSPKDPTSTTLSEYSQEFQNWELLPDPFGFIIDWQTLRHENRDRKDN